MGLVPIMTEKEEAAAMYHPWRKGEVDWRSVWTGAIPMVAEQEAEEVIGSP